MNPTIKTQIRHARPKLRKVAPLTAYLCWGYAFVNLLLGLGMIFLYSTTVPIAVASVLGYETWGGIFLFLSGAGVMSLLLNSWKMTRFIQLIGLLVKSIWAIALIARCIVDPRTILITAVWLFFAYVQIGLYVHFIPQLSLPEDGEKYV